MISRKINIRHETCLVIFFITMLGIFALECPTNKCECYLTNDNFIATISCTTNSNSVFRIYIEEDALIEIHCSNSPEWSDFDLNMTLLGSYKEIKFDNCNLPSNNSLSDIAHMLGATSVEKLYYSSHNNFNLTLKKHHLNGFKNLTYLRLFDNNLHNLTNEFFYYTTQLMILDLRNNKLKLITPGTFDKLNNLIRLELSSNHLTQLELGIFDKLIALRWLNLGYNYLVTLPEDMFLKLKNLNHLFLYGNNFTDFPKNLLQNNKNLMLIDMSGNRNLTLLDRSFNNMEKLKILWLQVNGLIALPEDLIWGSFQLQFIDLRKNYLESLPKHVFRDAINLKTLLLKSNNIKVLSDYIFKNTNLLEELDLSHNRITSISRNLFNGLHALKKLYMEQNHLRTISFESFSSLKSLKVAIFSNNHLTLQSTFFYPNIVPKSPFHYCRSLKELYLSHNNISDIIFNGLSSTIQILELHSNNISKIRPVLKFLRNSTNLIYLTLYDNPWECNCDAVDFLHFIHTEYREITKISKVSQVICHGINKSVSDMSFYDFCPLDTTAIIIISVLITLTGFIICILGLYYKYQKHIKIWLFAHEWCLRFVTEEQLDKEKSYDAFVSYSHNDHSFIINELIPKLENGPTPYKLCLHYRDCSIYECVSDVIAKSVTNSRRTIVILSPNFLDSVWGKMEFRVSHCQALSEGRAKVILIFYDDIGPINDLDAELKAIITMSTCIQWGDSWFWDKLKYALPHQSIRPKSIVEREVVESGEL